MAVAGVNCTVCIPIIRLYVMKQFGRKFASEVHLGLLVIVFVLLLVNVAANVAIYHARVDRRESVNGELNAAALAISRMQAAETSLSVSDERRRALRQEHGVSDIVFLPSFPDQSILSSEDEARRWLVQQLGDERDAILNPLA